MQTDATNFIAVDLGASSGRVLLGQWNGTRFDLCELHRFPNVPMDVLGHIHWDVLRLWTEIKHGLHRYATQFNAPLMSIGIDSWGVDFGLLDRHGQLLGNPYHYRDRQNIGMAEAVAKHIPPDELFGQTGLQILPFNTLYQLYSMVQRNDPQLRAADTLLMIPDLLNYWLTGRKVAEYTNASTTQFLDCRTRRWATPLLERLGIPGRILPPMVAPGTVLDTTRREVMAEVGLYDAVPVITPATHDTGSAVAGIPGLDADSVYISSGTWSLVGVEINEPITSEAARKLNVTNEGGVAGTIRLLKNVAGLWLLQEVQRVCATRGQHFGWDELLAQATTASPFRSLIDPDALDFLNPPDMPAAIQAFCRIHNQPAPDDVGALVLCCLESLALRYRWVIEALEQLTGRRVTTIRLVGGGCLNKRLCQLTADVCDRVVVAGPVEATALGNLMVQAITMGQIADLTGGRTAIAASVTLDTYVPLPQADVDQAYDRFCRLIEYTTTT